MAVVFPVRVVPGVVCHSRALRRLLSAPLCHTETWRPLKAAQETKALNVGCGTALLHHPLSQCHGVHWCSAISLCFPSSPWSRRRHLLPWLGVEGQCPTAQPYPSPLSVSHAFSDISACPAPTDGLLISGRWRPTSTTFDTGWQRGLQRASSVGWVVQVAVGPIPYEIAKIFACFVEILMERCYFFLLLHHPFDLHAVSPRTWHCPMLPAWSKIMSCSEPDFHGCEKSRPAPGFRKCFASSWDSVALWALPSFFITVF